MEGYTAVKGSFSVSVNWFPRNYAFCYFTNDPREPRFTFSPNAYEGINCGYALPMPYDTILYRKNDDEEKFYFMHTSIPITSEKEEDEIFFKALTHFAKYGQQSFENFLNYQFEHAEASRFLFHAQRVVNERIPDGSYQAELLLRREFFQWHVKAMNHWEYGKIAGKTYSVSLDGMEGLGEELPLNLSASFWLLVHYFTVDSLENPGGPYSDRSVFYRELARNYQVSDTTEKGYETVRKAMPRAKRIVEMKLSVAQKRDAIIDLQNVETYFIKNGKPELAQKVINFLNRPFFN